MEVGDTAREVPPLQALEHIDILGVNDSGTGELGGIGVLAGGTVQPGIDPIVADMVVLRPSQRHRP